MFLLLSQGASTGSFTLTDSSGDATGVVSIEATSDSEVRLVIEPDTADPSLEAQPAQDSATIGGLGGVLAQRFLPQLTQGLQRMSDDPDGFTREFMDRMVKAMFFLLPAFALILKMLHWRRLYVQHLVFAIYFHSFVFLLVALVAIPEAVGFEAVSNVLAASMLTVPIYLLLAMRRFYRESWLKTVAKLLVLSQTYLMLGLTTVMVLLMLSIMTF
jgi:hypothetical protein